jgi:predicted transcriptional regulator of viral defense system
MTRISSRNKAHALLEERRGFLNVEDFANRDVNRVTIRELVSDGTLANPAWGIYIASDAWEAMSTHKDWALIAYKYPEAVFSLKTAAMFHDMTQEIHGSLTFFCPRRYGDAPKMGGQFTTELEPLVTRKDGNLRYGVNTYVVDGVDVRVTSRERTLVDFFRFSPDGNEPQNLVSKEMLYDLVQRMAGEDSSFDFDRVAALAMDFGCFDQLGRVTGAFRFRSQAIGFIS